MRAGDRGGMAVIDLNCDLGEGAGHDEELMPLITSANIACGVHAGNGDTMKATVALARRHGVAVGAHPGFPGREGFGREGTALSPDETERTVAVQVRSLCALAPVHHVKPHGLLYNRASRDAPLADAVARAVRAVDPALILYGLAGGELLRSGLRHGLRIAAEGFVDRSYEADGSLTPRSKPGAVILDDEKAVAQALRMVREGRVRTSDGTKIPLQIRTLCVHGDRPGAAGLLRRLRAAFAKAEIPIRAL